MRKLQKSLRKQYALIRTEKLRAKRANDLFKVLVRPPVFLWAPRGPPGGGLLTPGLLLTGGPSYEHGRTLVTLTALS
jgi:hypothetical protein